MLRINRYIRMIRRLLDKLRPKREVLVVVQTTRGQVTVPADQLRDRLNTR